MNFEEWLNKNPVAFAVPKHEANNMSAAWNAAIAQAIQTVDEYAEYPSDVLVIPELEKLKS